MFRSPSIAEQTIESKQKHTTQSVIGSGLSKGVPAAETRS